MGKLIPLSRRVPRKRDDLTKEICISCGHYIYETQEIQLIPIGPKGKGNLKMSAQHVNHSDCRVSINLGEPRSPWGPTRK